MPQKSLANFFVGERGKAIAFWAPPGVQLNHLVAVINASLEGWRIPHFRKYLSTKAEKPLGTVLVISRINFSEAYPRHLS
jgi:hypothetical protein